MRKYVDIRKRIKEKIKFGTGVCMVRLHMTSPGLFGGLTPTEVQYMIWWQGSVASPIGPQSPLSGQFHETRASGICKGLRSTFLSIIFGRNRLQLIARILHYALPNAG
jgi:hypothetical protein